MQVQVLLWTSKRACDKILHRLVVGHRSGVQNRGNTRVHRRSNSLRLPAHSGPQAHASCLWGVYSPPGESCCGFVAGSCLLNSTSFCLVAQVVLLLTTSPCLVTKHLMRMRRPRLYVSAGHTVHRKYTSENTIFDWLAGEGIENESPL